MTKKIVDLHAYKTQRQDQKIKDQIIKLDALADSYTHEEADPVIKQGYKNFMRFLKAVDKRYAPKGETE
jgi:hypothetical protein